MKKLILLSIALFMVFSCSNNKETKGNHKSIEPSHTNLVNDIPKNTTDSTLIKKISIKNEFDVFYNSIDFDISSNETSSIRHIIITTKNHEIKLATFFEHEYTYLLWRDNPPIITEFYFTHRIEKDDIILFKCQMDYVMALSSYTEEFNIYELIKFSNNGIVESLGLYSYDTIKEGKEVSYILGKRDGKFILISKGINKEILNIYNDIIEGEDMPIKEVFPKIETYLNIRSAPNTGASKIIGKVYISDKLFVLGDLGEWSIIYFNGIYGYVNNEFIK